MNEAQHKAEWLNAGIFEGPKVHVSPIYLAASAHREPE